MSHPRVSICIPAKDMVRTIRQTVESARAQTYPDLEILLVDNRSTDGTPELIEAIGDARIRVVRNPQDVGVYGNHNRCLELARGEFIKFLHADDLLHPQCVEQMLAPFEEPGGESVACVVTGAIELDQHDREFRRMAIPSARLVLPGRQVYQAVPSLGNFVGTPSQTLLRKRAVQAVGGFDPQRRHGGEFDCWMKLAQAHDFCFVPAHLVWLRSDPPPADPAKRYDYAAVLYYLDVHKKWFARELGGQPLWHSPFGRWMCREAVLYTLAYGKEALRGRPKSLTQMLQAFHREGLLPQLAIQLILRSPGVVYRRYVPTRRWPYAKVARFLSDAVEAPEASGAYVT